MKIYLLLLEMHDDTVEVARGKNGGPVVAVEGNQYLLSEIGNRLLEEGVIKGHQLLVSAGPPVREI